MGTELPRAPLPNLAKASSAQRSTVGLLSTSLCVIGLNSIVANPLRHALG